MARTTEPVFRRDDRGGVFYAWVPSRRTGKAVPRSTGKFTEGEAVAWRRRYLRQEDDPTGEAARNVTLEDVLNAYLESRGEKRTKRGEPLSPDTLDFYQSKASMVGAVLGANTLAAKLAAAVIDGYISTRRKMPAKRDKDGNARTDELVGDHTISKELAVLRAALTLAKRRGKWKGDADALFPSSGDFSAGYDPKKAGKRALSRLDVAKLAAVMKPEKFAVLAYAIATSSEMAALERARWIDISEDRATVHVRGTKNEHRDADVPIATLEQALLLDFAMRHAPGSGTVLFPSLSNIRRDFATAAVLADVHHFSPHNVRHTLAQWLTAGGVASATVGRSLRHADGRMVETTYGHLRDAEDVRSAINAQYKPSAPVGFRSGIGGADGAPGEHGGATRHHQAAIFQADPVPGDGIEPPTRGFSTHQAIPGSVEGSGTFSKGRRGFGLVSDPDAALKAAIHAAVEGGLYERARALLDVLSKTSTPAEVVDLRDRRKT